MSDNSEILALVKMIDDRTTRMEISINKTMQKHQEADDSIHEDLRNRLMELENNKKTAKIVALAVLLTAVLLGGAAGGAAQKILEHWVF